MLLHEKIKQRREELEMSQQELADLVGYKSRSSINKIEKGINDVAQSQIVVFAKALRTTPAYLMGWEDDLPDMSDIIIPIKKEKVSVIGSMACGEPVFREEDFPAYVAVGNEVKADAAVIARGDSMIGARINNGDIVFIHYQPTVENGEIAAIWVDDGFTIKRVYQYGDTIVLRPENSDYDETIYKEDDAVNIKIIGKAVAFQSDVK